MIRTALTFAACLVVTFTLSAYTQWNGMAHLECVQITSDMVDYD